MELIDVERQFQFSWIYCNAETKGDVGSDGLYDDGEEGGGGNAMLSSRPYVLTVRVTATSSLRGGLDAEASIGLKFDKIKKSAQLC